MSCCWETTWPALASRILSSSNCRNGSVTGLPWTVTAWASMSRVTPRQLSTPPVGTSRPSTSSGSRCGSLTARNSSTSWASRSDCWRMRRASWTAALADAGLPRGTGPTLARFAAIEGAEQAVEPAVAEDRLQASQQQAAAGGVGGHDPAVGVEDHHGHLQGAEDGRLRLIALGLINPRVVLLSSVVVGLVGRRQAEPPRLGAYGPTTCSRAVGSPLRRRCSSRISQTFRKYSPRWPCRWDW